MAIESRRSSSSSARSPTISAARSKSTFSSWSPISAFVAGVKIGSGSCSDSREPGRQVDPADGARGLVVLPARARDVAAHDALDRHHLEPLDQHRATGELLRDLGVGDEVVGADVAQPAEPEGGQAREDLALVRDRRRVHDVVGRDAVGGDQQQAVLAHGVDVPHLPACQVRESGGIAHGGESINGSRLVRRTDG